MRKTEIIKKYTEFFGKRPTLKLDDTMSADEQFKIKQVTKINQYIWSLKKSIFTEYLEKSTEDPAVKLAAAKAFIDKFTENDFLKIYHGYQYTLNIPEKTYVLFQD